MNFRLFYEIWMAILLSLATLSGVAIFSNVSRKLMTAFFVPATLVMISSALVYRSALIGEATPAVVVASGILVFCFLSYWAISRSMVWGVARAQRYVKVDSTYLVVDEELFPDPVQSAALQTDEQTGEHEVQGHWRVSASGTRHWVRAHTRSNPPGHEKESRISDNRLREKVETTWEPDGPPVNTFTLGWRWFWQSIPEAEFVPLEENTDFDFVVPVRGQHFGGHRIAQFRQLECPTCQQVILQFACTCGEAQVLHESNGQWYSHPSDHLK
jgi:hypothetical protein